MSQQKHMFVYGTLKQGEANHDKWMALFMAGGSEANKASEDGCTCGLAFVGTALTVERYPFIVYDYPSILNAPYKDERSGSDEASCSNEVADTNPDVVYHKSPQRVLGQVYEVTKCPTHMNDVETSRVVRHLDHLEDTASGLYSRFTIRAEVSPAEAAASPASPASPSTLTVDADIYFRTDCFPSADVVSLVAEGDANAAPIIVPEPFKSHEPSVGCEASGRVVAPTVKGFLRTFRGRDHTPIKGE